MKSRSIVSLCALLVLFLAPAVGRADPVLTSDIREPDLAAATDVVIISEGYGPELEDRFLEDAGRVASLLRRSSAALPMRRSRAFNVHVLFEASRQSGAPWTPGQAPRRTLLRARVVDDGTIELDMARAEELVVEHAPDVDVTVVLVNLLADDHPAAEEPPDPDVVSSREEVRATADVPEDGSRMILPANDIEAFIHELGHALYGLDDEYWDEETEIPADERWQVSTVPNLTVDPSGRRWAHLLDTPPFEGGGYYAKGVWRPEEHCRMRETRERPFCAVCLDAITSPPTGVATAPVWIEPRSGASYVIRRGRDGRDVVARWRKKKADDPDPLHWALELYRADEIESDPEGAEPVWDDYVEGHVTEVSVPVEAREQTRFRICVRAVGLLEESDIAKRTFTLRPSRRRGRPPSPGLRGRLEDGDGDGEDEDD